MTRVFIDTGAHYAFLDRHDEHNVTSTQIFTRLAMGRYSLFTSNFVIAEAHALLLNRAGHAIASRYIEDIYQSKNTIIRVSARDEARARDILARYEDKEFSYTDATSFAIMERLHIPQAFAFDHHFAQYGFELLA